MLDPVAAEIKLIHRNYVLGKIVMKVDIIPEIPLDGVIRELLWCSDKRYGIFY